VQVQSSDMPNEATNIWFQHLINRIIVAYHLQGKLLHEAALFKQHGKK